MKNLDVLKETMSQARENLFAALRTEDEGQQKEAFNAFLAGLQEEVTAQAKQAADAYNEGLHDEAILVNRGIRRSLTTAEKRFFAEAVQKQKVSGLDNLFPQTIIEDVYRNLVQEHPLLSQIDVQQGTARTEFIYGDATKKRAFWSTIPADIKQILLDAFKKLDIKSAKLSGFLALPKGYFELGPDWLANYVITFLREVMSAALEEAVVNGDGDKKPLGMMRKLSGDTSGVYPEKTAVAITDLKPATLAGIRGALAKAKTDNGSVVALVNPVTYWSKLFPVLAFMTVNGQWVNTQLPTGESIVLSHAVPEDKVVFGVLKNYLLVVSSDVEINQYPETLAIEDMDLYVAKFFGRGIAKNENAFFVADVSGIQGATLATPEGAADIKADDTINP